MAIEFDQSESVEAGSSYCTKPGTYHLMITDYEENPETKAGKIIEDGFKITCEIGAGTESSEVGKKIESTFYPPAESQKDGGEFSRKKLTRFYLAINKGVHQAGQKAVLTFDTVVGRQFIAKVKEVVNESGKKFYELDGLQLWHVDDIAVEGIEKNQEYLEVLDSSLRMVTSAGESGGVDLNNV